MVLRAFDDIGLHNLVKTTVYVDRNIVDMILHGMALDSLSLLVHDGTVTLGNLIGEYLEAAVALHVNEIIRLVAVVELEFLVEI